jgi:hypothetical protein
MRGCVAALFSSILALSLSAQCTYLLGYSGEFRASYLDLTIDGTDLWAATSYGVQLFDRSVDPPSLVASTAVPGITKVIRVANGVAYAGSSTRVYAIRKNGKTLSIAGSAEAGATINDMVATPLDLYVATANGLRQYDLLNASSPTLTPLAFVTSGSNVTSLALSGSTLYAVDGDSSVEAFSITVPTLPLKLPSFDSLPRPTSVKTSGSRVYVSDGNTTDVFIVIGGTPTKASTAILGTSSLVTLSGDVVFAAGTDRRFRGIDWTLARSPVELFASDIAPTAGTVNRIGSIQIAGNRMFVAAGDAGLLSYDVTTFLSPYLIRTYFGGATTSAAWVDGKLYVNRSAGGISEYTKNSVGALTAARQWDARVHIVHDGASGFLLTSSGATLFYWTLVSTIPVQVTSATFKTDVVSATLIGFDAYAVLSDRTVWHADLSKAPTTIDQIATTLKPLFVSGFTKYAIADPRDDGTTTVQWFGDPASPRTFIVPGSSNGGLAVSSSYIALFTFQGISIIDVSSGNISVLPQSNRAFVRKLAVSGNTLLALTDTTLDVWDVAARQLTRSIVLPEDGTSVAALARGGATSPSDTYAAVTSPSGIVGVAYGTSSQLPALIGTRGGNVYYRKALALADRLYLFDGRAVDIFDTRFGFAPHLIGSVRPAGIVDFTISASMVFTITGSNVVNAFTRDGVPLAQATLNEGNDVQPNRLSSAGGALWVSISSGCFTGACVKKTLVLDPVSLVRTAVLDGDAVEVAEIGGRAYAIFDLPAQIRSYSLADALHPSPIASIAAEGTKTPVSIAVSGANVYVDGEKLYVYDTFLTKLGEQFDSYQADLTNTLQYTDQRVRADGGCVLVSARTFSPQFTAGTQSLAVPAVVKSMASVPGRFYVLTDYSLEVWTSEAPVLMPRRRGVR